MILFCIFFQNNLHISKKSCIFAPDLEKEINQSPLFNILTIIFNSQITLLTI